MWRQRIGAARAFWAGVPEAPPPVELVVEVTNSCNLACVMCPRPQMKRPVGRMEMGLFRKMVDEAAPFVELVQLAGGLGEPLAHPHLPEMVSYCKKNGLEVGISTNGTLLEEGRSKALLRAEPDLLLISLDGASAATHESIRVGSSFKKTTDRVSAFLHEKTRMGLSKPYTVVQMVTMPQNEAEALDFRKQWAKHPGVDVVRFKRYKDLLSENPRASAGRDPHASCLLPWRQISVGWDGTVGLCCRDLDFEHPIGDLQQQSFSDIWNGPSMQAMRRSLAKGGRAQHPLCARCDIFESNIAAVTALTLLDGPRIRHLLPLLERGLMHFKRPIMGY